MRNSVKVFGAYVVVMLSLFVIEVLVFTLVIEFTSTIENGCKYMWENFFFFFFGTILYSFSLTLVKSMFYYPIYIIPFVWLVRVTSVQRRPLKIAIINSGLYVFISLLYAFIFIPKSQDFFAKWFFYAFILATFLSPLILSMIPYYKKLIKEL